MNRCLPEELQRQSKGKWQVTVVAPHHFHGRNDIRPLNIDADEEDSFQLKTVRANFTKRIHFFYYSTPLKSILQSGFDLVHAWEEPYVTVGMQIAFFTPRGTPLVFRTAQSLSKSYPLPFRWIERYCVRRMAGWIFSGGLVEENLLKRPGYAERPRLQAPLGFDTGAMFVDRSAGEAVLRKLGWDDSIPIIGYLGRFVTDKGLRVLMQALDGIREPWRALLVGNGPMLAELQGWANQHPGQVALCTDVRHENVAPYINAMDMMVAPSLTCPHWREQFGRMLVEAFACGVPVIGSDSGEIPFVIRDSGVVVPENDSIALGQAILNLMGDPSIRKEFSDRGLERAHSEYTWAKIATKTLGFFEEILESNR